MEGARLAEGGSDSGRQGSGFCLAEGEGLLEGLHRERLPNGLGLWLLPMERHNMVSLRLNVPAEAQYEGLKEGGLAHFVEHLLLDRSFLPEIEDLWSEIEDGGGAVNASTGPQHVVVAAEVRPDNLDKGLELLLLCLTRIDFSDEHVENERKVLLREILDSNDNRTSLATKVWERLLQKHPVTRSPGGDVESIRALEPARLKEFFDQRYRASGLTLIVAGQVNSEDARAEVIRTLGALPSSEPPPGIERPRMMEEPCRLRESKRWEEVLVGYQVSGVRDPDYHALWYLRDHLDDVLYERIRREMHVYHMSCELVAGRDYGVLYVWAQLPAVDQERLIARVDEAFRRLAEEALDSRAWVKLHQRMINRSMRLAETADELAFHLLGLAQHYDVDDPVPDDVLVLAEVSPEDLVEAARRHFVSQRRVEARAKQRWFRSRYSNALIGASLLAIVIGLWENCRQQETDELRRQLDACHERSASCLRQPEAGASLRGGEEP
jgi:predicted Zn-dependent peptidase